MMMDMHKFIARPRQRKFDKNTVALKEVTNRKSSL